MIEATEQQVTEAFEAVVEEFGVGYVYPDDQRCQYFGDDGEPMCVVGQIVYRLGYRPITGPDTFIALNQGTVRNFFKAHEIFVSGRVENALRVAQRLQDGRANVSPAGKRSWGVGLEAYKKELGY